jgi:hypothetical protein
LPDWATMAQLMPLARPSAHNDSAAEVDVAGVRHRQTAMTLRRVARRHIEPARNPLYRPCLAMTVAGSKPAYASALPPNSRAMDRTQPGRDQDIGLDHRHGP